VLYVRVAADSQMKTTLQAPPLEHLAAIGAGHALAEAVNTHAPPDLGLISSLWHYLTPKKLIKTPYSDFTAGVFEMTPNLLQDGEWTGGNYNRGV
jgi:hypothetical protein